MAALGDPVQRARDVLLDRHAVLLDQRVLLAGHAAAEPEHHPVAEDDLDELAEDPDEQRWAVLDEMHDEIAVPQPLLLLQRRRVDQPLERLAKAQEREQALQHPAELALREERSVLGQAS